jgi:hypothetical protein
VGFILVETGVFSGRPRLLAFGGNCFAEDLAIFFDVFFVFGRSSVGLPAALLTGTFGRACLFRAIFLGAAVFLILEYFNPVFLDGFSLNLKTGSAAFLAASAFAALRRLARVGPPGGLFGFVTFTRASMDSVLCGEGGKMKEGKKEVMSTW